ncbi:MAG: fibronectin type 3 and ankyrin repeat domain protein 1 [Acidobacteriota bacterium]|nr:fibronectin type 3 and ankyrin repeat domain protein 1 [Acidobacteriota bacterium]
MPNPFPPNEQNMKDALSNEQKIKDARSLSSAVADGDARVVAALLEVGLHADTPLSTSGETPLMRASARGYTEVVRVLLDAGADSNAQRADGFTPLILAVFFGHEEIVRLLVERGADPSARTQLGMTATRWAGSRGFAEMAGLLRRAEAARPRADTLRLHTNDSPTRHTKAVTLPSDEVSIFSRKGARHEARASIGSVLEVENDFAGESGGAGKAATSRDFEAGGSRGDKTSQEDKTSREDRAATGTQTSTRGSSVSAAEAAALSVSVRRDAKVPAHPSASTFRFGHFLRSWQGSVGTALLLLAFGVAVFALWRGGTNAREVAQPSPQPSPTPTQTAVQTPPAQTLPTPQPSPALPTPDAQAVMPVTDPAYASPYPSGQPYYVPPVAAGPGQTNASRDLVVVSEGGTPSSEDSGRPKRKTEAGANDSASGTARGEGRDDVPGTAEDSRANRSTRTPDPEQRSAPPARSSTQTTPPAPEPSATPGRGKVIQWPPQ